MMDMGMHGIDCQVWGDEEMIAPCACPRPWRVRKDRLPTNGFNRTYPWVISRYIPSERAYDPVMRAVTVHKALSLVRVLVAVTQGLRRKPAAWS